MRDLRAPTSPVLVDTNDLVAGEVLWAADVDSLTDERRFRQRMKGNLGHVRRRDEIPRLRTATEQHDLALLDDRLTDEDMRVQIHERCRPKYCPSESALVEILFDAVLDPEEWNPPIRRIRFMNGDVDETAYAACFGGVDQSALPGTIDVSRSIGAPPEDRVRGRDDHVCSLTSTDERIGIEEISFDDVGAFGPDCSDFARRPRHDAHGVPRAEQPRREYFPERSASADDEDHSSAPVPSIYETIRRPA